MVRHWDRLSRGMVESQRLEVLRRCVGCVVHGDSAVLLVNCWTGSWRPFPTLMILFKYNLFFFLQ